MPDDDFHVTITQARDALHRRDFDAARALWAEVRTMLPDHPLGYLGAALMQRQAGHATRPRRCWSH